MLTQFGRALNEGYRVDLVPALMRGVEDPPSLDDDLVASNQSAGVLEITVVKYLL